jgi:uncharacterized flavoprotein (TIGR03862 family)
MRIAVVGAGPAGLFAAEIAAQVGARVTLYDRMRLPGRKFLLAGRGGLNLTHSEDLAPFITRYREGGARIENYIRAFPPHRLRAWAHDLGQETFVGSSGRVFPRAMKSSPLLRAWLGRLERLGVAFHAGCAFTKLEDERVWLKNASGEFRIDADAVILCLGGASWPELGGNGDWAEILQHAGVPVAPLHASNAGALVRWPDAMLALAGAPFKLVEVQIGDARFRGEAIVTASGLEGGAIYAANGHLRRALSCENPATIHLDLQPNRDLQDLAGRLARRDVKRSLGPFLQKNLGLSPPSARLITSADIARAPQALANAIKSFPLQVHGMAPIARAISSAGGVAWTGVNPNLSLQRYPKVFVAGEMLDWDAPTGGYLLQACFATAYAAAHGALGLTAPPA